MLVSETLQAAATGADEPEGALYQIGCLLLQFTATEKAIIINRAAVADMLETGMLAKAIEDNARQVMLRQLGALMERLEASGLYAFEEGAMSAVETFIALLLGEVQMQQALGAVAPLTDAQIETRSRRACDLFDRLFAAGG